MTTKSKNTKGLIKQYLDAVQDGDEDLAETIIEQLVYINSGE